MPKLKITVSAIIILTIVGSIISGWIVVCIHPNSFRLVHFEKFAPEVIRNKFLVTKIEKEMNSSTRILENRYRINIEQGKRNFGLPYASTQLGKFLQNRLGMKNLRIYDETFRLIYSDSVSREVFNKELRFSENSILPGNFSKFETSEIYRSLDGMNYFSFRYPENFSVIEKLNVSFEGKYWVYNTSNKVLRFTNDLRILSGSAFQVKMDDFLQKENTEIKKFSIGNYSIFLQKEETPLREFTEIAVQFFLGVVTFSCVGYFLLYNYLDWEKIRKEELQVLEFTEKEKLSQVFSRIEKRINGELRKHVE